MMRRFLIRTSIAGLILAGPIPFGAVSAKAAAGANLLSAAALYADGMGKEAAIRRALDDGAPPQSLVKAVRTALASYEAVLRHYPTSGYCDDALWRAAQLALDAAARFKEPSLRPIAHRYLRRLASEYPSSKYAQQAAATVPATAVSVAQSSLGAATAANASPASASGPATSSSREAGGRSTSSGSTGGAPPVATATSSTAAPSVPAVAATRTTSASSASDEGPARLLAIHRAVLPDVVRLTLDVDREVPFRQHRLNAPDRIFYDLSDTISARSLAERTIRFDSDVDVARQVRIGQQAPTTVRVVFDAAGVAGCSASPLYEPYRLVIECVRSKPAETSAAAALPVPKERPKPITPATFARKAAAAAAPTTAASTPRMSAGAPVAAVPVPRPLEPLARRVTTPLMGEAMPLASRAVSSALALSLPAGTASLAPAQFAAIRLEMAAPAALAAPPVAAPTATLTTRQTAPVPTIPSRTIDGKFSLARQLGLTVSRVVIDPGHGGHDPGAKSAGTTESALVLDIALRLEALLQQDPGIDVVLTRRTDAFVALEERTAIANRAGADLFLSIHANASAARRAAGVETYYLNFANTASAAAVAARENAASGQPMNALPQYVKAIAMNGKLDESRDLANHVQRALVQKLRPAHAELRDLGVKQAPFVVLIGATMPSVLAEVSFLTNADEARLLKGPAYRQRIAEALSAAVHRYQSALAQGRASADQEN